MRHSADGSRHVEPDRWAETARSRIDTQHRRSSIDGERLRWRSKRIDHVRMFVGNARQSAYFYRNAFGFEVIAYAGLETGVRHEACYVLRQGHITFVLASPLRGDHPDAQRLVRHGDGVQSIALEVDDVPAAFEAAVARGAKPASPPRTIEDEFGAYEFAEIHAYGDTTHTLVNRSRYRWRFRAGVQAARPGPLQPAHVPSGRAERDRPHRRQCRGRQDGRLGRLLQQGHGLLAARAASTTRTSAPTTRP